MKIYTHYVNSLRVLCTFAFLAASSSGFAAILPGSNGGNNLLHGFGWQTFENATPGNNNSGISDATPDSNSTYDATPRGSHSGGFYLTGRIGAGASDLGRAGFGQSQDNGFLNGPQFGSGISRINIEDVPLADGSPGRRIGAQGQSGTSSWKFRTNGNQEFGDFSITNHSDYAFRLEMIHFAARVGSANSPTELDLVYLAGGDSNLVRASTGTEVPNLHVLSAISFGTQPSTQTISAGLAGTFGTPTAVRLAAGDTASFRFRWTGSATEFAESQIDNLFLSGTFQDPSDGFALIDPVAVPEPGSFALIFGVAAITSTLLRRRRGESSE